MQRRNAAESHNPRPHVARSSDTSQSPQTRAHPHERPSRAQVSALIWSRGELDCRSDRETLAATERQGNTYYKPSSRHELHAQPPAAVESAAPPGPQPNHVKSRAPSEPSPRHAAAQAACTRTHLAAVVPRTPPAHVQPRRATQHRCASNRAPRLHPRDHQSRMRPCAAQIPSPALWRSLYQLPERALLAELARGAFEPMRGSLFARGGLKSRSCEAVDISSQSNSIKQLTGHGVSKREERIERG
ncbi:hypothetical protein B0H17DRAFT_317549 [Mycena rosella]|uniref:Uncharacterized protein n=1 Tax=Mycena rosella TaxID=1033263 RepID=A0AAD7DTY5_MYCRO|nr:hypothetical protein B0H17DRAFT_317549 [Mycena rosella]